MSQNGSTRRGVIGLAVGAVAGGPGVQSVARSSGLPAEPRLFGPLAGRGPAVFDTSPVGYSAEEYFLIGTANVLESVNLSDARDQAERDNIKDLARRSFDVRVLQPNIPYVTRLIVYRPLNDRRFSGIVHVEPMHFSHGGSAPVWNMLNDFFTARGDAHVCVQNPVTFDGLKSAFGARYAQLFAADPTQMWGMLADTGRLLRSESGLNRLGRRSVAYVYMTGYSYSGVETATFAQYHHDEARDSRGNPFYAGYAPMGNVCYIRDLDVPVMRMNTQSDFAMFGGVGNRKPDCDKPFGRFRLYEVPGAAHVRSEARSPALLAPPTSLLPAPKGQPKREADSCAAQRPSGGRLNDFPLQSYAAAMMENLHDWVSAGVRPPAGAFITVDEADHAILDKFGLAKGGLRSAEVVLPCKRYTFLSGPCWTQGYVVDIPPPELRQLYGDHRAYMARFDAFIDDLKQVRLLRSLGAAQSRLAASERASYFVANSTNQRP